MTSKEREQDNEEATDSCNLVKGLDDHNDRHESIKEVIVLGELKWPLGIKIHSLTASAWECAFVDRHSHMCGVQTQPTADALIMHWNAAHPEAELMPRQEVIIAFLCMECKRLGYGNVDSNSCPLCGLRSRTSEILCRSQGNLDQESLKFWDCIGRKFSIPFHLVKTWEVGNHITPKVKYRITTVHKLTHGYRGWTRW